MMVDIDVAGSTSTSTNDRLETSDGDSSGASTPSIEDTTSPTPSTPPTSPRANVTPTGRSTPPPTYEQCMKEAIPLSFVDFWPHCLDADDTEFIYARFESFDRYSIFSDDTSQ